MRKILILTVSVMATVALVACQNKPVIEDQDMTGLESSLTGTTMEPETTSTDVAWNQTEPTQVPAEETPTTNYDSLGASSSGLGK